MVGLFKRRPRTLRVFLVRPGAYSNSKALTEEGKSEASQAGRAIKARLGRAVPTVCLPPNDQPVAYTQTANIIAEVLGVQAVPSKYASPPGVWQFPELEKLGGPVVIVLSGTHLLAELVKCGVRDFARDRLGYPLHGSAHEQVITYLPDTLSSLAKELTRKFVA